MRGDDEAVAWVVEDADGKRFDYADTRREIDKALRRAEDDTCQTMTAEGQIVPYYTRPFRVVPLYAAPSAGSEAVIERCAKCCDEIEHLSTFQNSIPIPDDPVVQ